MRKLICTAHVVAATAALAIVAFSEPAQAVPPCTHKNYQTPAKCNAPATSHCKWCPAQGYCWWKNRDCEKWSTGGGVLFNTPPRTR
ncbi:MAG TPA: hypothetical protein VN803_03980 [Gemmatimonadales bacterium]|nr:hypothetical protein [Gemmatimonadales bacterium]